MKKKLLLIISFLILLTSCSPIDAILKNKKLEPDQTSEQTTEENISETISETRPEEKVKNAKSTDNDENELEQIAKDNAKVEKAFKEFFQNKRSVYVLRPDGVEDLELEYYYISIGEYYYDELKRSLTDFQIISPHVKYALADLTGDDINEIALLFDCNNPSPVSWTAIIKYDFDDDTLYLTHSFEGSERSVYELYTSGLLKNYGPVGAGGYLSSMSEFDSDGFINELYFEITYFGNFAEAIFNDLDAPYDQLKNGIEDIALETELYVTKLSLDDDIYISVSEWSKDSNIKAKEQAFINELEDLGAIRVSVDELQDLMSIPLNKQVEVEWIEWEIVPPRVETNEPDPIVDEPIIDEDYYEEYDEDFYPSSVFIDTVSTEFIAGSSDLHQLILDDSEYSVTALLSTDGGLQHFTVYYLTYEGYDEYDVPDFSGEEIYYLEELHLYKPLAIRMTVDGTLPSVGIAFFSGDYYYAYSIGMSGLDGSLYLEPINLNWVY